jgi:septation ring formation regulator EzrA
MRGQNVEEAMGELGAALAQALPSDDQIIIGHVTRAHALITNEWHRQRNRGSKMAGERYDYLEALNLLVQEQTKALSSISGEISHMAAHFLELKNALCELNERVKALEERRPSP